MAATVTGTPVLYSLPGAGESTSTFSVTVPSGATGLLVCIENVRFPPRTVSTVTFNGDSLASLTNVENTTYVRSELWAMDNPDIATGNVEVTWSGASRGAVTVLAVTGADAVASWTVGSNTSGTLAITSTTDGLVVDNYAIDEGDSTTIALTAGTSIANHIGSTGGGGASSRQGVATQAGTGGSVSFTWTPTGAGAYPAHTVVNIPATSSGPTIPILSYQYQFNQP